MDFMTGVHAKQAALAETLGSRIHRHLTPQVEHALQAAARTARIEVDDQVGKDLVAQEIQNDVLRALVGYTDWLATSLWRKRGRNGTLPVVALPRPSAADAKLIADEYGLEFDETLSRLLDALCVEQGPLPAIGSVNDGQLHVDMTLLTQWADHYDWSTVG